MFENDFSSFGGAKMTSVVVVGSQWGDEGKGKITDFLSEKADVVARYQGGDNAGHTIKFNGDTYKLHLIPSGIFYKEKICVLGNGMVINPKSLVEEINYLKEKNTVRGRKKRHEQNWDDEKGNWSGLYG